VFFNFELTARMGSMRFSENAAVVVVHGAWAQRFMAERMNATVRSFPVDHTPLLTAPDKVVDIILESAQATLS
jgi:hypothetical protein